MKKVHALLFSHIKLHWNICLELFLLVNGTLSVHISLLIQKRQLLSLEKALLCIEESYCNQKFPWKGMFSYDCNLGSLKSPAISPVVPVGDLFRLLSQWQLRLGRLYSFLVCDVICSDVPITPWIDFTCASRLITQSVPHSISDATFVPSLGNRGYSRNRTFLSSQDINWWMESSGIFVDYCDVFIIYSDSHSGSPHSKHDPLMSKCCNAKLRRSKLVTLRMAWGWVDTPQE